ncbi:hypothetical protein B0H13DRAFT_1866385 [Mycena leptocephala]|nr:hypothetical protein B0H13DRAFT_1866385 [Mycena leptocephala]
MVLTIRKANNKDRVLQYWTVAVTLLKDIGNASIRKADNKDRVLQYGTVAATLLKAIGNAPKQPYLQAIVSVSLLIMETVQRVRHNKDACIKMTERVYEVVCAIINICHDKEADLAPATIRSTTQTLEKILVFVRNHVKGGLLRRMFRSVEDQTLITECNQGLKHALDVFGVQPRTIAAMAMAEMKGDTKQRHEELIVILKERRSKPKRTSTSSSEGSGSSSSRRKRPSSVKSDLSRSAVSVLPASPKIFYGREEELTHVVNTITQSKPARIAICGADGLGKTALALAASHSSDVSQMFGIHRYFVECEGAKDPKQLVAALATHLGVESTSKKHVIRHLSTLATETTPVLVVLDALDRAWMPHENRSDVEDFLSLLADLQYLTLIGTVRGSERPRQVKWTRPFLPTLGSLSPAAARSTFLDISGADPEALGLEELLTLAQNNPSTITKMAMLAWFEGCASLVVRQDSGIRRRVPPSNEEDYYHPSVLQSLPDAHFTIPEVLRKYLRNVPFHLPSSSSSPQPQPNPIGGHTIWGEWLTLPDLARWLTKIGNYIGAAYVFVIAPPFVHDRTTVWDLERLGRRLGAFQTWVWAANAALFA